MFNIEAANTAVISETGYEFELLDQNGRPTEATVTVRGRDSEKARKALNKFLKDLNLMKAMLKKRGKDENDLDLDQVEEMSAEMLAARIVTWKGLTGADGKEIPYAYDTAVKFLGKGFTWLREQVSENSDNLSNFTKN